MPERDPASLARAYYESIDAGTYDRLAGLLAPDFVHVRGDRTIDGRDAFVQFMRDERPDPNTAHAVDAVYAGSVLPDEAMDQVPASAADREVAVRGRLRRADGSVWFGFVDVFAVEGGRLARLTTYSNSRVE